MRLWIVLFTVLFAFSSFGAPDWYLKQELEHKSFEIIGYGEGKTKDEAFMNSASEISAQILVHISSKSEFYTSSSGDSSNYRDIKSKTSAILKGLQIVKSEKENIFYVALKFVNLPLVSQVAIRQGEKLALKKMPTGTLTGRYCLLNLRKKSGVCLLSHGIGHRGYGLRRYRVSPI